MTRKLLLLLVAGLCASAFTLASAAPAGLAKGQRASSGHWLVGGTANPMPARVSAPGPALDTVGIPMVLTAGQAKNQRHGLRKQPAPLPFIPPGDRPAITSKKPGSDAVSGDSLYWHNYNTSYLDYSPKVTSPNPQHRMAMSFQNAQSVTGMTYDGNYVFEVSGTAIRKFSTADGSYQSYTMSNGSGNGACGCDNTYLYIPSGTSVYKYSLTGSYVNTTTINVSSGQYAFGVANDTVWVGSGYTNYGYSTAAFNGGSISYSATWNTSINSGTMMNVAWDGTYYYIGSGGSSGLPFNRYYANRTIYSQGTCGTDVRSVMCSSVYVPPPHKDIGCTSIPSPTGDTGTYIPSATIHNWGDSTATSFGAHYYATGPGATYDQTITGLHLVHGGDTTVTFPSWHLTVGGNWALSCSTQLTNDSIKTNDKFSVTRLIAPNYTTNVLKQVTGGYMYGPAGYGYYNMGYFFTPQVNGQVSAIGRYRGSYLGDSSSVSLWRVSDAALLARLNVGDSGWAAKAITPVSVYAGTQYCVSTYGGNDVYYYAMPYIPYVVNNVSIDNGEYYAGGNQLPNNNGGTYCYGAADIWFDVIHHAKDVATISIPSPAGDTGTYVPSATIHNWGDSTATSFDARYYATGPGATYDHTITSLHLRSGADTVITFPSWHITARGVWAIQCSTKLTGDQDNTNDKYATQRDIDPHYFTNVLDSCPQLQVYGSVNWNGYCGGLYFTPQLPGEITTLGRYRGSYLGDSSSVSLWRVSDQALLARVTVGDSGWGARPITPVSVDQGTQYCVSTYGGDQWYYAYLPYNPITVGNVSIDDAWYEYGNGDVMPTMYEGGTFVMGAPDVYFAEVHMPYDIGCTAIPSPKGDTGTYTPSARIHNWGDNDATSFDAHYLATGPGTTYDHTVTGLHLASKADTVVTFPSWHITDRGAWALSCSTQFASDTHNLNDKFACTRYINNSIKILVACAEEMSSYPFLQHAIVDSSHGMISEAAYFAAQNGILRNPDSLLAEGYKAILTFGDYGYYDQTAMGDTLALYMEHGGGVVMMVFGDEMIGGRYSTQYMPIPVTSDWYGACNLGTVLDPEHPIMAGVDSVYSGEYNGGANSIAHPSWCERVANWDNGRVQCAAYDSLGVRSAYLGFFPVQEIGSYLGQRWVKEIVNALLWSPYRAPVAHEIVVSPNGGEAWTVGTSHNVIWSSAFSTKDSVVLMDATDSTNAYLIGVNTPPHDTIAWTVPNHRSTNWKVKVYGFGPNGNGSDMSNAVFSIVAAPDPFGLTSPANHATEVAQSGNLTWEAANGATNYDIYFGTGTPPPLWHSNVGNVQTYPYSGLPRGTLYHWAVIAKNTTGNTRCNADFDFTTVIGKDVGTVSLTVPATVDSGATVNPTAVVHNYGTQAENFDVALTFAGLGGYTPVVTVTGLSVGVDTTISFPTTPPLTNTAGYAVKCTTELTGDQNTGNDAATANVAVVVRNVGVVTFGVPAAVDSGSNVTPTVTVRNYGTQVASFNVNVVIGGAFYNRTQSISGLSMNKDTVINFPATGVMRLRAGYAAKCTTQLTNDMVQGNDRVAQTIAVNVHDLAAVGVVAPSGQIPPGPITPMATFRNRGTLREPTVVYFMINSTPAYFDSVTFSAMDVVGLPLGVDTTIAFPSWTAIAGTYVPRCSVYASDQIRANDAVSGQSFQCGHVDVAVLSITAPANGSAIDTSVVITPAIQARNNGELVANIDAWFFIDTVGGNVYNQHVVVTGVNPGAMVPISFPDWAKPHSVGHYATSCSVHVAFDGDPSNNAATGSFSITSQPAALPGWTQTTSVLPGSKAKNVKDGAALAAGQEATDNDTGYVYAFKGNNRYEFYRYNIDSKEWISRDSIPAVGRLGKKKAVKKGSALIVGTDGKVYGTKGNNTLEFWCYDPSKPVNQHWGQLADVPAGAKALKEGTGLAAVNVSGTNYLYLLRGSGTTDFYRYNIDVPGWETMLAAPVGASGKGYKNGSSIAYDGGDTIWCLKGSYNEFAAYSVEHNTWVTKDTLPKKSPPSTKKTKVKDGSQIASDHNGLVYALKGGNTNEFWTYKCSDHTWNTAAPMPDLTKKVKGGGGLTWSSRTHMLYAFRGNNTLETWIFNPPSMLLSPEHKNDGAMSAGLQNVGDFKLGISPNPFTNLTHVSYTLPKSGSVALKLYDVTGQLVTTLAQGYTPAGSHSALLNADKLAHGIYLLKLESDGYTTTSKLIIQ